ncbi:hypothetical protein BU16DRAFT_460554 [Lophium mytilinum]|uniref:PAC domain-containing protein n=1 Tax=Lophium mytilinum TaxID=390894 RepID=A0A6A6QTW2_9PEZI|nr:hypothetical protein BU16DRAFT_460554 [Lophium mytilinum]
MEPTEPTAPTQKASREQLQDEQPGYDLQAPPPFISHANGERLADKLFSASHLDLIVRDDDLARPFKAFIDRYRPMLTSTLSQYIDSQKATFAVQYANAVIEEMGSSRAPSRAAATLSSSFHSRARVALEELVTDALPAYITHRMTSVVTETLVKEITGNNAPIMRQLVQGLAEVFCLTDPSIEDNPIVYASEEFFKTTQYGREYVLGRNCRFLQGPKTSRAAVTRLRSAIDGGQEVCDVILNYKRDGTPFLNLVLVAPLYDNRGKIRYFIGAQIDITYLVEGGRGLESFQRLLNEEVSRRASINSLSKPSLKDLAELGQLLDNDERHALNYDHHPNSRSDSGRNTPVRPSTARTTRRYVGMDEAEAEASMWPPSQFGPSGRLPGVYQNYLLVRPAPSLRITFLSPALRIPGLLQSRFLSRIGGPAHVREGITEALTQGIGVTAKISWLHSAPHPGTASSEDSETAPDQPADGKPRWIHCTPLIGSDSKVGVWMVVMVEREEVTGRLNRVESNLRDGAPGIVGTTGQYHLPFRGAAGKKFEGGKLYADYLRREGKSDAPSERSLRSVSSSNGR